jgi:hypothetical protein
VVIIEFPDGDTSDVGDDVKVVVTVRDPDGVGIFEWGVFTENKTPLKGDKHDCGGQQECRTDAKFEAVLSGTFQFGVEARDTQGNKTIEVKQLYVG